ncbi:MAG: DNA alkylation repair protein [Bacteroidales bacterium]|nr:DNA alkylation repair protein [Bacteroidales bacterium]
MGRDNLIARLKGEAEEQYRIFNQKFVLTNKNVMLGVKVPRMRSIAREIAGGDWEDFLMGYGFCVEGPGTDAENGAASEATSGATYASGSVVKTAKFEKQRERQQQREELCRTIFFEEVMIIGMVIDLINVEPVRRLSLVEQFVPLIDNWAVCDVFCGGAKWVGEPGRGPKSCNKIPLEQMWEFLQRYLFPDMRECHIQSESAGKNLQRKCSGANPQGSMEFEIRFGVVMLMSYFLTEEYIGKVLLQMEKVRKGDYYVDMAVAWCLATARAKFDERTQEFLRNATLTPSVIKKYEQKVRDSLRVKKGTKLR